MEVIVCVEMDGCRGQDADAVENNNMSLHMVWPVTHDVDDGAKADSNSASSAGAAPLDTHAILKDAIWRLQMPGAPLRYMRLSNGRHSLKTLMKKYSFVGAGGCVFSDDPHTHAFENASFYHQMAPNKAPNAAALAVNTTHNSLHEFVKKKRDDVRRRVWKTARLADVLQCTNTRQCTVAGLSGGDDDGVVGPCHFESKGIRQISDLTGVCWYSALLFALLKPPDLAAVCKRHVASRALACSHCAEMHRHVDTILNDTSTAEQFRRYMYSNLGIGDDPDGDPKDDGQNGGNVLIGLLRAIGMGVDELIYAPNNMQHDAPMHATKDILIVRASRNAWTAPERMVLGDNHYYVLQSCMVGSTVCRHQTSVARSCQRDWWCYSDADAHMHGIGPICFKRPPHQSWDKCVSLSTPHTNASLASAFCDMAVERKGGSTALLQNTISALFAHHSTTRNSDLPTLSNTVHNDAHASRSDDVNVDYVYLLY